MKRFFIFTEAAASNIEQLSDDNCSLSWSNRTYSNYVLFIFPPEIIVS